MESLSNLLEDVCSERESVDTETLEQIVTLAVELAHEGREGRKVGTFFPCVAPTPFVPPRIR